MALEVNGVERHKEINHFNYTEHDYAEKKLSLHDLKIMFPSVSEFHASLIYDMCKNSTPEEIEALKLKADQPFKYDYTGLQEVLDKIKQDITITMTSTHHNDNVNDNENLNNYEDDNENNSESENEDDI